MTVNQIMCFLSNLFFRSKETQAKRDTLPSMYFQKHIECHALELVVSIMTSYMLNRRHFSKCLPSTNFDFHCFFQQNSTSQEEYETTRTGTTPQYFILSPFQYCNDVTLFSKFVLTLISVVSWLSTENTFLKHFDFLTSEKICSCLRAFSKVKLKLKCLVQTCPDYFTVILSKSCYTRTSNQSKYRSKAQPFHLLEDIVTNFIVK